MVKIEPNEKIQIRTFETNKTSEPKGKIHIGPNQPIQIGPGRVIQLTADQTLSFEEGPNPTAHIEAVQKKETEVKDLSEKFISEKIFLDKVKMVKLAHGFINDDFIFESD